MMMCGMQVRLNPTIYVFNLHFFELLSTAIFDDFDPQAVPVLERIYGSYRVILIVLDEFDGFTRFQVNLKRFEQKLLRI